MLFVRWGFPMEEKELRRADFLTSLVLVAFGVWVLREAFKMPLRGSYAGVKNVWYVSPALFPIIVGVFIVLLGTLLLVHAIRSGGAAFFVHRLRQIGLQKVASERNLRFLAVLLALGTFVYLFIPRVDFFLAGALFLLYTISAFSMEDIDLLKRFAKLYALGSFLFAIVAGGFHRFLAFLPFPNDVLALVFLGVYVGYGLARTRAHGTLRQKFVQSISVALLVPLLLCVSFRFFLLVPLPREGLIMEGLYRLYYALFR